MQRTTVDSSMHLKEKNCFISFAFSTFLSPLLFPHFHSKVATILNLVFITLLLFFAVWVHLCISSNVSLVLDVSALYIKTIVWYLFIETYFFCSYTIFCFIHILVYTWFIHLHLQCSLYIYIIIHLCSLY